MFLPLFIPHYSSFQDTARPLLASLPECRAPVTECHGTSITRSVKNKDTPWERDETCMSEAAPQPATLSREPQIFNQKIQICAVHSLPWCAGAILYSTTGSGQPSFLSFLPQLGCLEKSLVGLLEHCRVTQVAPQVVPCRSIIFPAHCMATATHGNKAGTFLPPTPPAGISHPNLWKLDFAHFALHTWTGNRMMLTIGRLVTGRAGIVILRILHMATNVVAWIHTGFKPGMLKYQLPVGVNMPVTSRRQHVEAEIKSQVGVG